jgi:hypothetical protein
LEKKTAEKKEKREKKRQNEKKNMKEEMAPGTKIKEDCQPVP